MRFFNAVGKLVKLYPLLIVTFIALFYVTLETPFKNGPAIRSDGVGYHIWTHAILSGDFRFCQYKDIIDRTQAITFIDEKRGVCQIKYPAGVALLRFLFMAPFVDPSNTTNLSKAEHNIAVICGAMALVFLILLLLWSLKMLGVNFTISQYATFYFVFGTGLFHYATYDNSFSHIYSALVISSLGFLFIKQYHQPANKNYLWLGFIGFMAFMIRPSNLLILGFMFLAYLLFSRKKQVSKAALASAFTGVITGIVIHLSYNFYAAGSFSISSYGKEKFDFTRSFFDSVLLSYERGLFTYYPIFALSLFLGFISPRLRVPTTLFLGLILVLALLYGFWPSWFLGGGFGHRGFIETVPIAIVIFALTLNRLSNISRKIVNVIGLLLIGFTLNYMCGYWQNTYPMAGANSEIFWQNFFKYPICYIPFGLYSVILLVSSVSKKYPIRTLNKI